MDISSSDSSVDVDEYDDDADEDDVVEEESDDTSPIEVDDDEDDEDVLSVSDPVESFDRLVGTSLVDTSFFNDAESIELAAAFVSCSSTLNSSCIGSSDAMISNGDASMDALIMMLGSKYLNLNRLKGYRSFPFLIWPRTFGLDKKIEALHRAWQRSASFAISHIIQLYISHMHNGMGQTVERKEKQSPGGCRHLFFFCNIFCSTWISIFLQSTAL